MFSLVGGLYGYFGLKEYFGDEEGKFGNKKDIMEFELVWMIAVNP